MQSGDGCVGFRAVDMMSNAVISGRGSCVSFAESVDRFCEHIHVETVAGLLCPRRHILSIRGLGHSCLLISHLLLRLSLLVLMRLSIDVFEFPFMPLALDVPAFLVTMSFHRGPGCEGTKSRQGNTDKLIPLIRTRQLHVVSYVGQDMWDEFAVSYPLLGRIASVTYLVFGTEFWFDFLGRV